MVSYEGPAAAHQSTRAADLYYHCWIGCACCGHMDVAGVAWAFLRSYAAYTVDLLDYVAAGSDAGDRPIVSGQLPEYLINLRLSWPV